MGTSRQTTPRPGATLGDSDSDHWLRSEECGFYKFRPDEELAALWSEYGGDIVEEHVADSPGTRPSRWWEYDAPRSPVGTYPGCFYDGQLPEPRERLGGTGTPAHEVRAVVPDFKYGIATVWVDS